MFTDDLLHLLRSLLHPFYQPELRTCTDEVVLCTVDPVVMVPVEIIGQEPQTDDEGHEAGGEGQASDLGRDKKRAGYGKVAFGIPFEQVHADIDFRKILLVLCGSAGAGPDRIPEIIEDIARHYGIQVDNTQRFSFCVE